MPHTAVAASSSLTPGHEFDVVRFEVLLGLPQRLVQTAERRAAIAGDEASRVQPGRLVAPALHQRQPHQRLDPRQIDAALNR